MVYYHLPLTTSFVQARQYASAWSAVGTWDSTKHPPMIRNACILMVASAVNRTVDNIVNILLGSLGHTSGLLVAVGLLDITCMAQSGKDAVLA